MDKTRVKLTVCGSDYVVVSENSEAYVRNIGEKVSEKIDSLMEENPKLTVFMAAVLSSIEFCDELNKALGQIDELKLKIKQASFDAAEFQEKYQAENIKVDNLNTKIASLKKIIHNYQDDIDKLNKSLTDALSSKKVREKVIETESLLADEIACDF